MLVSKKSVNTLPLDNSALLCCESITWLLPMSLHSAENTRQSVQRPCVDNINHFHCSVLSLSSCRAFPWQQEPLGGCCSVPKWRREQLFVIPMRE
jgi:hypothetical protein